MIQDELMHMLKNEINELEWTVDYYTSNDNTGTVFVSSGSQPDMYDTEYRYPSYQVYIRTSDWDLAKQLAEKVFQLLQKKHHFKAGDYYVYLITAATEPIRVRVIDDVMEYSINFDASLIREEQPWPQIKTISLV